MSYIINQSFFDELLCSLKSKYRVYAPVTLEKRGRFSDTDLIKYKEINSFSEMKLDEKSHFSPKEVFFPISQTMFYFNENSYKDAEVFDKEIIIFARPCDINGTDKLDNIFLKNGNVEDPYYKRLREKVTFFMIECRESFENCFCVSMDANKTDNYALAFRFGDEILVKVKDTRFEEYFKNAENKVEFEPEFVEKNFKKVTVPKIEDITLDLFEDPFWDEYSDRCIACGRCNTSCITCSCFTTKDITYTDNPDAGERRRVWASCHIDKFSDMAGGHSFRKKYGQRMRYKTFHKIYDYKKRFGSYMCIGCGRCDDMCPEYISFSNCINKLNAKLTGGRNAK